MKGPIQAAAMALLAAGMLLATPPAQAQAPSGAPTAGKEVDAPYLSDEKLDAAAAAIVRVNALTKDYREQFEAASPEERERIADEADAAIEQAVTDTGLSVDEYNMIIDIAQNDPEVQSRILERLPAMPDED